MSRTRAAVIWVGLFAAALAMGILFEGGLPARVADGLPPGKSAREPVSPSASQCRSRTLTGKVTHVRDGDTIVVAGIPIRLSGLAAPEMNEPGGRQAAGAMRALVHGRELRCQLDGTRTYDRCAGVCYLGDKDIAAQLVRAGLARDCPRYSRRRYAQAERLAAAEGATIGRMYPLPGYCR